MYKSKVEDATHLASFVTDNFGLSIVESLDLEERLGTFTDVERSGLAEHQAVQDHKIRQTLLPSQ